MRIVFFIIFFLSFDLAAELLKPSYLLKPDQVIAIQLTALKNNLPDKIKLSYTE